MSSLPTCCLQCKSRAKGGIQVKVDYIIIRQGRKADESAVWRLLHAEGRQDCLAEFAGNPEGSFVLLKGEKLLGVYLGTGSVAVHPLYSENLVGDVLTKTVAGLHNLPARPRREKSFSLSGPSVNKPNRNYLQEGLTNGNHQCGQY
jgi:hypothetical protein